MKSLITEAYMHVPVVGPHVAKGQYNLVNARNEIILPQLWGEWVQPGGSYKMFMWPIPEEGRRETKNKNHDSGKSISFSPQLNPEP